MGGNRFHLSSKEERHYFLLKLCATIVIQDLALPCHSALVQAASIGAFTVVEAGAKVGRGAVIGKNCKICARVQIGEGEVVGYDTVVFGSGWGERRAEKRGGAMDGKREVWVKAQKEVLKKAWTGK